LPLPTNWSGWSSPCWFTKRTLRREGS